MDEHEELHQIEMDKIDELEDSRLKVEDTLSNLSLQITLMVEAMKEISETIHTLRTELKALEEKNETHSSDVS